MGTLTLNLRSHDTTRYKKKQDISKKEVGTLTLEEMKASDAAFVNAADVAPLLGCGPHFIRVAAHEAPELLGFPTTILGRRVLIPRKPFLAFIGEDVEAK